MITLVNSKQAKVGYEFINYGAADECKGCGLTKACLDNLEEGRKYRVVRLRDIEHDCKVHERVRVVEVEEGEVLGAMDKKLAFSGAKIIFEPIICKSLFCPNSKYCSAEGLMKGDECKIVEVSGPIECEKEKNLVSVKLKRTG
jgi:hypothetical protein